MSPNAVAFSVAIDPREQETSQNLYRELYALCPFGLERAVRDERYATITPYTGYFALMGSVRSIRSLPGIVSFIGSDADPLPINFASFILNADTRAESLCRVKHFSDLVSDLPFETQQNIWEGMVRSGEPISRDIEYGTLDEMLATSRRLSDYRKVFGTSYVGRWRMYNQLFASDAARNL